MSPRERAARKLYEREPLYFHPARDPLKRSCVMPWEEADDGWRAPYYARVDAVLDEIREPSAGMVLAALVNSLNICERDNLTGVYPSAPNAGEVTRAAWVAMIDAVKRGEG